MTTRMVHPDHGAMHAYDTGEIERLQKFGWSVEVPEPFFPTFPSFHPVEAAIITPAVERKKPGPKPKAK